MTTSEAKLIALPPRRQIDREGAERAMREFLSALGVDPTIEDLRETPRRVVDAFTEFLTSKPFRLTTFRNEESYSQLILAKDIPFHSLCTHHLLPFSGVAHVAYLPAERILGLSKLARVVEMFSRSLQVQERLTQQIADWLQDNLQPQGVGVILEAEHTCMTLRGVQKPGSRMVTSALHGVIAHDQRTREEFLALARPGSVR